MRISLGGNFSTAIRRVGGPPHLQETSMLHATLRRFDVPDKVLRFPKGRFELVDLAGLTIGRATHEPGYKWSVDNAPIVGT